jgi:hypothetical protein
MRTLCNIKSQRKISRNRIFSIFKSLTLNNIEGQGHRSRRKVTLKWLIVQICNKLGLTSL